MGWAPLPSNASIDDGNTVASVPVPDPTVAQAPAAAAPVAPPAPIAASASQAPGTFEPLPANAKLDDAAPAQVVHPPQQTESGFGLTDPNKASQESPEVKAQLINILATHPVDTAAADARTYLAQQGFSPAPANDSKYADSFDEVVAYRKAHGEVSDDVINRLPQVVSGQPMTAGAAALRGVGDAVTAGLVNPLDAALHAGRDVVTGDTKGGFVDDFHRREDENQAIIDADEANHPYARLTGQILGGLAIPTGLEGVGLEAGKSVLVAGGTMREARAAAATAVRNRVAAEGAAYGAVHGGATAEPGNGVAGAVEGAMEGGAGGYALTAAGQVAPKVAAALGSVADKVAALLPASAAAKEAAPDYAQIARELGIRRTPATNSASGVAPVLQAGLGALPGGTPISAAADREAGDLANAARSVADRVGRVSDRQGAGEAIAQGAEQYKATSKGDAKALYKARDELIGGLNTPVSTNQTKAALDDISSRFPTSPAIQQLREHPAIRAIGGALPGEPTTEEVPTGILDANGSPITRAVTSGGTPLTLGEVTEALSHVRGVVRNLTDQSLSGKATAPVLARVQQVKQGLQNDVMNAAARADIAAGREPGAEGSALKAQQDADAFYADRAQALNGALKKPLQSAADDTKMSGESVYNQVLGDMGAKSGNLARLRETWFRLPDTAKRTFAATAIDDLGRASSGAQNDAGNAWSFNTFLTNRDKMAPQARNIVFGAKADSQLDQIATYANRLRQLDRSRNFSNTAKTKFAGIFMGAVGGLAMHGDFGAAMETAAALPTVWGGAKFLLATPAMRDWTAQSLKALTLQGSTRETALKVLTKRLGSIAVADPSIASEASGLQRQIIQAANDNMHQLAASGSQQQPQAQHAQPNAARQ